jgi:hypothetical protein
MKINFAKAVDRFTGNPQCFPLKVLRAVRWANHKQFSCRDNQHMKTVPVNEVYAEVMKVLL